MELHRSIVYMLIGIPGSGKTTWAEKKGLTVHSSDTIRARLANNQLEISHYDVYQRLHKELEKSLEKGEHIVFDATNVEKKY